MRRLRFSWPRRIAAASALSMMALLPVLASAGPASADPRPPRPCYAGGQSGGSSCNGMDPHGAGYVCSVYDPSYNPIWISPPTETGTGYVKLVYSPYCNANWAIWSGWVGQVYVHNNYGNYGYAVTAPFGGWTQMVDGSTWAQACAYVTYYPWACTHWY